MIVMGKLLLVTLGIIERILKSTTFIIIVFIIGILCGIVCGSKLSENKLRTCEQYERQILMENLNSVNSKVSELESVLKELKSQSKQNKKDLIEVIESK